MSSFHFKRSGECSSTNSNGERFSYRVWSGGETGKLESTQVDWRSEKVGDSVIFENGITYVKTGDNDYFLE